MPKLTQRQTIKRFLYPVYQEPRMYARMFFWQFVLNLYGVYVIRISKEITKLIGQKDYHAIITMGIIFGIISVLYFIATRCTLYQRRIAPGFNTIKILQAKYIKEFIGLDNSEIEKLGTGKVINIIDSGMRIRRDVIKEGILQGVSILIIVGISLYTMISFVGGYGLLFFVVFGIVIRAFNYITKKVKHVRKIQKELRIEYQRQFVKIIMSKNEILQANKIDHEISKLHNNIDENKKYNNETVNNTHIIYMIPDYTVSAMRVFAFCYVGYSIFHGTFQMEMFVPLIAILGVLESTFGNFVSIYMDFVEKIIEVEKLWDMFDTIPAMKGVNEGQEFVYKKGDIHLQNISFAYGKNTVLEKFNLTIPGGKKTAFVGPSGGGKTTLIKLLAGYISPDTGEVSIDSQKLSQVSLQSYYAHIGYLTQDPSIFDGTIRENLMYGIQTTDIDKDVSQKRLYDVVSLAKCDFIRDFEKGLETEIGERGIRLSGGQKQRLAIAKIMLKNPNIIFLDEPTSAMDSFNEEEVTQALHNLFQDKTVIVVAHRLQTVKQADKIYYLAGGENGAQIMEEGTHDELVKKNGKYKKMLDLQSGF